MKLYIALMALLCFSILPNESFAKAVDIEVDQGEGALYILFDDGEIQFSGRAKNFGFPSRIDAIDLVLTPSGNGYYVLEEDGTVHSFGDAVLFGFPVSSRENVVDMELTGDSGFYFLREDGTIITMGDAKLYGYLEQDNAVDLEMTIDGNGYTILYDDGSLAFFGTAINYGFQTFTRDKAVDLELVDRGYYILMEDGSVLNFGEAVTLPSTEDNGNELTAFTLTGRGYRTLDEDGNVLSVMRLENQGSLQWFAQSTGVAPQQAATNTPTPRPVTPTPTPRPTATPRQSVPILEIAASGFTARTVAMFPATTTVPQNYNASQVSLLSGDTFAIVSVGGNALPRAVQFFQHEEFGGTNNTGTLFAQLNEQRGEARIRGISYSRLGLIFTVEDVDGTRLILVEGQFDDSAVNSFFQY